MGEVYDYLVEIPSNVLFSFGASQLILQILEQRMSIISVYFKLFEHLELNSKGLGKGFDTIFLFGFLSTKLITRKGKDAKTFIAQVFI